MREREREKAKEREKTKGWSRGPENWFRRPRRRHGFSPCGSDHHRSRFFSRRGGRRRPGSHSYFPRVARRQLQRRGGSNSRRSRRRAASSTGEDGEHSRMTGDAESDGCGANEGQHPVMFIDNLCWQGDERAIRWLLRMDKDIEYIFVSRKKRFNSALNFALVRFSNSSKVEKAVGKVNGRMFLGRKLFARRAKYPVCRKDSKRQLEAMQREKSGAKQGAKPFVVSKADGGEKGIGRSLNSLVSEEGGRGDGSLKAGVHPGDRMDEVETVSVGFAVDLGCPDDQTKRKQSPNGGYDRAVNGGDAGVLSPNCDGVLVGGACKEGGGEQAPGSGSRDSQQKLQTHVSCCCCRASCSLPEEYSPCSKEEKAKARESGNKVDDFNEGFSVGGLWSSVPYSALSWWFPIAGYWVGHPTFGFDQPGWWAQPQGWGLWPIYSSTGYNQAAYVQQSLPFTHPIVQHSNDVVNKIPCQGTMETVDRVPVSIRKPVSIKVSGPDPVMEDIVNKAKGGMEEEAQGFDRLNIDVDMGTGLGHIGNGSGDRGFRNGSESGGPQVQALEEDLEDVGLRSLFEEPEFPPGFEPVGPTYQEQEPEDDPEEAAIKEEARQTLSFAKQLGCTVPNEKLTLSNYEELIRKQRTSSRRSGHVESEESIEESDRCSRSSGNDKGKRVSGTRPLGFSKFSRVRKVAMRGKKKAK